MKKCVSPTHALVGFRYGDTKVVPTSFITPVGGAMPCPLLQVPASAIFSGDPFHHPHSCGEQDGQATVGPLLNIWLGSSKAPEFGQEKQ